MSFFAIATLSDASLAQCRASRYSEGVSNAGQSYDASLKAFGPRAGLTGGVAHTLATCLIDVNRLEEASKLLREIDTKAVAQLTGFPDWGANVALSQAEIAYREGDYTAARKFVESAAPILTRPDAEPYQKHALETLKNAIGKHLARK